MNFRNIKMNFFKTVSSFKKWLEKKTVVVAMKATNVPGNIVGLDS